MSKKALVSVWDKTGVVDLVLYRHDVLLESNENTTTKSPNNSNINCTTFNYRNIFLFS